jgi:hypothetical protein
MKQINFIDSLPIKIYREIKRWYIFSRGIMLMTLIGIIVVQLIQIRTLYNITVHEKEVQKKSYEFDKIIEKKHALNKKHQEIAQRMADFKDHKNGIKNVLDYLQYLHQSPFCSHIRAISMQHNNSIEINGQCFTVAEVMKGHQSMSQLPYFNNLKIVNLQAENQKMKLGVYFTIKGSVQSSYDNSLQSMLKI